MKQKILYADYEKETGFTNVTAENKYGTFHTFVHTEPEDFDIENRWDGFRFCDYKIYVETLKAKYKVLKERANGMATLVDRFCNSGRIDKSDNCLEDYKWICRQLGIARREAEEVKQQYENMKKNYPVYCDKVLQERRENRARIEKELSA